MLRRAPFLFLLVAVQLWGCGGESVTTCASSRECSAGGLVCDLSLGRCVECVTGVDCLVEGEVCRASVCEAVTPCVSSRECPGLVCDLARGYCVECVTDVDCGGSDTCDEDGFCQTPPPPCVSDRQCSDLGLVCDVDAGECVECVRDVDCGGGFLCLSRTCRPNTGFDAGPRRDSGRRDAGTGLDAGPGTDAGPRRDGGRRDAGPSDPDAGFDAGPPRIDAGSCAPGSLFIVYDGSGSMDNSPDGTDGVPVSSSKWGLTRNAVNVWLAGLPDALEVGMLLFPTPGLADCEVSTGPPTVAVAPLSTNRALISTALLGAPVGNSAVVAGLDRGYDIALTMSTAGPRAVLLIADSDGNCDAADRDTLITRAATMRAMGIETYVIGLNHEGNFVSSIALQGGTRISPSCVAVCEAGVCDSSADCGGTTTCEFLFPGVPPGNCGCSVTELCPSPLTCGPSGLPIGPANTCSGDPNCCHHDVPVASFGSVLSSTLSAVSSDFLASCSP